MLLSLGILIFSIVILYFGAELSLNSSEKIGAKLGLPPLIIGMVLVGFGTSLPEFFVAHIAGVQGKAGLAIGGLIGSNIANMFLVLGICGLITKFSVFSGGVAKHLGVHFVLGLILIFVLNQSELNLINALPLLILVIVYLYLLKTDLGKEFEKNNEHADAKPHVLAFQLLAGFSMLYLGGEFLVKSGSDLCLSMGMSEYIVSAIFISFGTSFPELVTAVMAAVKKKHTDLIIGNIVGSNLFNCAFILGSLGIYRFKLDIDFSKELAFLVGGALILFMMSLLKKYFFKKMGLVFISAYIVMVLIWIKVI